MNEFCGIIIGYLVAMLIDVRRRRIPEIKSMARFVNQIQPATVCGWCLKHMRGPANATVISHSICPDCAVEELAKLPNRNVAYEDTHTQE